MSNENNESVQLLNTAIIKSKEKMINENFEDRLADTCESPAIKAISVAISTLADSQNISRDQAAMQIVETIRDLDSIWNDYVMMEGIGKLKDLLKSPSQQ